MIFLVLSNPIIFPRNDWFIEIQYFSKTLPLRHRIKSASYGNLHFSNSIPRAFNKVYWNVLSSGLSAFEQKKNSFNFDRSQFSQFQKFPVATNHPNFTTNKKISRYKQPSPFYWHRPAPRELRSHRNSDGQYILPGRNEGMFNWLGRTGIS